MQDDTLATPMEDTMKIELQTDSALNRQMTRLVDPHVQTQLEIMHAIATGGKGPKNTPLVLTVAGMSYAMALCHCIANMRESTPPDGYEPRAEDVVNILTSMMMTVLTNCFPDFVEQHSADDDDIITH
jgi:hypothetical protein